MNDSLWSTSTDPPKGFAKVWQKNASSPGPMLRGEVSMVTVWVAGGAPPAPPLGLPPLPPAPPLAVEHSLTQVAVELPLQTQVS